MSVTDDDCGPITLANDAVEVVVARLGGRITSLRSKATGREWLWKNPHLPPRTAPRATADFGPYDSGGWDEIFPTVSPCVLADSPWGSAPIADHGELWHRRWKIVRVEVDGPNGGGVVTLAVDEQGLPFRFERTLTLASGRGALVADYAAENRSDRPLPYLWAAHPLIAVEPGMTIALPHGAAMTAAVRIGFELAADAQRFAWPQARIADGRSIDFSRVPLRDAAVAAKLFSDRLAEGWVRLVSEAGDESLRVAFDVDETPYLGLWLNYGAWSGANVPPYFNCGVEPTTAPHDSLRTAVEANQALALPPGSLRRWRLSMALDRAVQKSPNA